MNVRELIEQAMTLLEQHDDHFGNEPELDEAYEKLQKAIDLIDGNTPEEE